MVLGIKGFMSNKVERCIVNRFFIFRRFKVYVSIVKFVEFLKFSREEVFLISWN